MSKVHIVYTTPDGKEHTETHDMHPDLVPNFLDMARRRAEMADKIESGGGSLCGVCGEALATCFNQHDEPKPKTWRDRAITEPLL
jgi:hypothetical protein